MLLQEARREPQRVVLSRGDVGDAEVAVLYVGSTFVTIFSSEEDDYYQVHTKDAHVLCLMLPGQVPVPSDELSNAGGLETYQNPLLDIPVLKVTVTSIAPFCSFLGDERQSVSTVQLLLSRSLVSSSLGVDQIAGDLADAARETLCADEAGIHIKGIAKPLNSREDKQILTDVFKRLLKSSCALHGVTLNGLENVRDFARQGCRKEIFNVISPLASPRAGLKSGAPGRAGAPAGSDLGSVQSQVCLHARVLLCSGPP